MRENLGNTDLVETFEGEIIQLFTGLAKLAGYPRSVGEIFGILFASDRPLAFDEIGRRRRMSAGTVSSGLRYLKRTGAVIAVPMPADRRDYFMVNMEFKQVSAGLFRQHLEPRIVADMDRIMRLVRLANELPNDEQRGRIVERVNQLEEWHNHIRAFIAPLLTYYDK